MEPFDVPDLNEVTRSLMLTELEADIDAGRVCESRRAVPGSRDRYHDLLCKAFEHGDPASLAVALATGAIFGQVQANGSPVNVAEAAQVLGDGQFIAYYGRAICLQAIEGGSAPLVYRGQVTVDQRAESNALVGELVDSKTLLAELRAFADEPWRYTTIGKPNSGLSIKSA